MIITKTRFISRHTNIKMEIDGKKYHIVYTIYPHNNKLIILDEDGDEVSFRDDEMLKIDLEIDKINYNY